MVDNYLDTFPWLLIFYVKEDFAATLLQKLKLALHLSHIGFKSPSFRFLRWQRERKIKEFDIQNHVATR